MNLLGRAEECAVLDGLLEDIRRGRSRSLVLRGEAGIGKTALLKYVIESASDVTVARAAGVESEMEMAYASLHQLCGPMLDHLPRLAGPQRQALEVVFGLSAGAAPDRFLVGLGVLCLISETAAERPLLCVVDDAQWLDQASALTLGFVARRLLAERVGIVFAAREAGQERQHIPELEVRGLRGSDARVLLRSAAPFKLDERVRDRLIAETGGNPLALLELPHALTATQSAGGFGLVGAQGLAGRIEESFARRLDALSEEARRLLLLAAAEPVGDPWLLWRAAERLGVAAAAAGDVNTHGLLAIEERVTFRHPLVRSAVYGSATTQERQTVHLALAEATDRDVHPDRRAWHLAAAAAGPDERIAVELEQSAGRAQARGGLAAAAAFLRRAVGLTEDRARRCERALAAAEASLLAGAFDAGLALLAIAETGPIEAFQRARVDLLRAEFAFASRRGNSAPALLLGAAKRIEPFDVPRARAGYLEALSAALFAARLAEDGAGVRDVAGAVQATPPAADDRTGADLLLDGWAALFADGCAAATPTLQAALARFEDAATATGQLHLLWLATISAPVVWDDARWDVLSSFHVELARSTGALSELPLALNSRAYIHLFRGELETADSLIEEARAATDATGAGITPWGAVALAALRGGEHDGVEMLAMAHADATERGEGIGLTVIAWARALLANGAGAHEQALAAARDASLCPTNSAAAVWGMIELIEATVQVGELEVAEDTARRFQEIATAAGTDWALGVHARSRALVTTAAAAEPLFVEALGRLRRCGMRVDLARTHLLYGEWLHDEHRRADARAQLRAAREQFTSIGMHAFAERARAGLLATGETVGDPIAETSDELTAQERQIARFARDGLSNAEIGARLFLSPRTIEWHLHKVFAKLSIRKRHELRDALPSTEPEPSRAPA